MNNCGKLEWFGGNQDALNMYRMFVDLAHLWDDLVDKDKDTTEDDINNAFLICLIYLPANPFYRSIQNDILPMWLVVVSSFQTANAYERSKDAHGIEIAHGLRYAAGNIIAYAVHVCVGAEQAKLHLPEMWKAIFHERFDAYREEHLNV
jgi:hypothetical protein